MILQRSVLNKKMKIFQFLIKIYFISRSFIQCTVKDSRVNNDLNKLDKLNACDIKIRPFDRDQL